MYDLIKFKKGLKSRLTGRLNLAEPCFITDEERLYIGGNNGNVALPNKQDVDDINTTLSNITINVDHYSGSDSDKLLAAVNDAVSGDYKTNKYVKCSRVLTIDKPIILDFKLNGSIQIDIQITVNAGIGTALTLINGTGIKGTINVINGGNPTDIAIKIYKLGHSNLHIFGRNFAGILFNVVGNQEDNTQCYGMALEVNSINCGQTLLHGESIKSMAGFGVYTNVWEESPVNGSVVQNSMDISFMHYETHFVDGTHLKDNLTLINVNSTYFGHLALGGQARYLFNAISSKFTIDKLHVGSEDIGRGVAQTTNGVQVQDTSIDIRHLWSPHINNVISEVGTNNKINVTLFNPNGDEKIFALRDGVSHNLPIIPQSYKNFVSMESNLGTVINVYRDRMTALSKQTGGTIVPKVWRETDANTIALDSTVFAENDSSLKFVQPWTTTSQAILDIPFSAGYKAGVETNIRLANMLIGSIAEFTAEFRDGSNSLANAFTNQFTTNKDFRQKPITYMSSVVAPIGTQYLRLIVHITNGTSSNAQMNIGWLTVKQI